MPFAEPRTLIVMNLVKGELREREERTNASLDAEMQK